ncbi:MAG: Gfo/Idh/MocA family protein [Chloroflexota bacterium]
MSEVNVGVIGVGDISDVYLANLSRYGDVVRVTACASRHLDKAQEKARQYGIPTAYASAEELIADPSVDIVLNLTTPDAHGELNLAAVQAGKHVYSEKPLAPTFAEASRIMELAEASGLSVGCAPDTFMGGRLQTCRRLIDEGRLGDIVGAGAFVVTPGHESFHPNPEFYYQRGAGPLLDLGPYYLHALLSLLGPVASCCAMTTRAFGRRTVHSQPRAGTVIEVDVDTHVAGTLKFVSGAVGSLITSFDVLDSELPRIEIYGTMGTICLKDVDPLDGPNIFGGDVLFRDEASSRWKYMPRPREQPEWSTIPVEHQFTSTSHQSNSRGIGLVDMANAIRDGREPRASGRMALHTVEIMEGLLVSSAEERFYRLTTTFEQPDALPVSDPLRP